MTHLLDTSTMSDIMRDVPTVGARLSALGPADRLTTSVVAAGELRYGVERLPAGRPRDGFRARAARALSLAAVEPVPIGAVERYAEVKLACERAGRAVGANDLWIAVVALLTGATLVTRDADFGCIPGLIIEDWSK